MPRSLHISYHSLERHEGYFEGKIKQGDENSELSTVVHVMSECRLEIHRITCFAKGSIHRETRTRTEHLHQMMQKDHCS